MRNRYPGRCQICGANVPADTGVAYKDRNTGRWFVRHAEDCDPTTTDTTTLAPPATTTDTYTLLSGHQASPYQAAVFEHFRYSNGSAIINAVAGAGKTTTIKNALRYLSPKLTVQLFAFNVDAANQLKEAIKEIGNPANIRAGTFHSVGYAAVARHLNLPIKLDAGKCRKLLRAHCDNRPDGETTYSLYSDFATRLVGYAKSEGIGALRRDTDESWHDLVEHHGMYLDSQDANIQDGISVARSLLNISNEAAKLGNLDYDDLLYLVVAWKLRLQQNDVVIVDEAQDTNPVRRAMLRLSLRQQGRLYAVGDAKQAIYGFTGASSDAMDLIAREFNTQTLPLTVSYRCAQAVVERAQTWVPYIEASPAAPEGDVFDEVPLHRAIEMLSPTDAILCRQTAPLVELAYALIAKSVPCRILGREIGEGLVKLIEQQRARGVDRLIEKLTTWRDREMAKFIAQGAEQRAEAVNDRTECVFVIIATLPETSRTVPALIAKIRGMFTDPERGAPQTVLTLSTIHRAKGLEWTKVAILRPDLMPSKAARQDWAYDQELNLMYVATTRAKETLIYCKDGDMSLNEK